MLATLEDSPDEALDRKDLSQMTDFLTKIKGYHDILEFGTRPTGCYVKCVHEDFEAALKPKKSDTKVLAQYKKLLKSYFGKFEKNATKPVYTLSSFIAPSLKHHALKENSIEDMKVLALEWWEILNLGPDDENKVRSGITQVQPEKPAKTDAEKLVNKFSKIENSGPIKETDSSPTELLLRHEIDQYLSMEVRHENPLDFWYEVRHQLPLLHDLATNILVLGATSHNSERTYSDCGKIVTPMRRTAKIQFLLDQVRVKSMIVFFKKYGFHLKTSETKSKKTTNTEQPPIEIDDESEDEEVDRFMEEMMPALVSSDSDF